MVYLLEEEPNTNCAILGGVQFFAVIKQLEGVLLRCLTIFHILSVP
jgi:hypothetical protein